MIRCSTKSPRLNIPPFFCLVRSLGPDHCQDAASHQQSSTWGSGPACGPRAPDPASTELVPTLRLPPPVSSALATGMVVPEVWWFYWLLGSFLLMTSPWAEDSHLAAPLEGSHLERPLWAAAGMRSGGERASWWGPTTSAPAAGPPTPQLALSLPGHRRLPHCAFSRVPSMGREWGCLSTGSAGAQGGAQGPRPGSRAACLGLGPNPRRSVAPPQGFPGHRR